MGKVSKEMSVSIVSRPVLDNGNSGSCLSGKKMARTYLLPKWLPQGIAFFLAVASIFLLGCAGGGGTGGTSSGNSGVGLPASVTATAGGAQSALISTAFTTALQATVKDGSGNVVANVTVTFTAPSTGASGTFANGTTTTTATTNSSGVATASAFTGNSTAGSYNITASVSGVSTNASFSLTNNPGLTAFVDVPTSVLEYAAVTLDGSLSASTATINSYSWLQTTGPTVALSGSNTPQASFTAPQVTTQTNLSFVLTVKDTTGATSQASASIQALPATAAQLTPTFVDLSLLQTFTGNDHNNLRSFDGPPLSGSTVTVKATLSGAVVSPVFTVVDKNGNILNTLTLSLAGSSSLQPVDFIGTMAIPPVPFRVVATGTTADGQAYSLPSPALMTPMYMTIAFIPPRVLLAPGSSTTASIQILNAGADATFAVVFNDASHLLSQSQNVPVQVAASQTATIPVIVTFPTTPNGLIHATVGATASVSGDPNRAGTATLQIWLDGAP